MGFDEAPPKTLPVAMWEIQRVVRPKDTYTRTERVYVVTLTAERALELVRERCPSGVTTGIVKRSGSLNDLILDPLLCERG